MYIPSAKECRLLAKANKDLEMRTNRCQYQDPMPTYPKSSSLYHSLASVLNQGYINRI